MQLVPDPQTLSRIGLMIQKALPRILKQLKKCNTVTEVKDVQYVDPDVDSNVATKARRSRIKGVAMPVVKTTGGEVPVEIRSVHILFTSPRARSTVLLQALYSLCPECRASQDSQGECSSLWSGT